MVLSGNINKGIANNIQRAGGRALGLSGKDDNLLVAQKLAKKVTDPKTGEVKVSDGELPWEGAARSTKQAKRRIAVATAMRSYFLSSSQLDWI